MPRYFDNYQEFVDAVFKIFPDAVINEDSLGELVINTGMAETTVGIVPLEEALEFWADKGREQA